MFGVDLYGRVRLAVLVQGLSRREAARRFGIDRGTVSKMVSHAAPPGYRRSGEPRRPKLGAHIGFIDRILSDDLHAQKKQRHTTQRIYERLRDERGFDGGYTTVRDYVHPRRLSLREAFVPLAHPAGHAQADFGEAWAVIAGVTWKIHFLVVALPYSDAIFVKAYPAETAEAFCEGHVAAFAFFGGVPLSILYDNTRLAVAKILGDGTRKRSSLFVNRRNGKNPYRQGGIGYNALMSLTRIRPQGVKWTSIGGHGPTRIHTLSRLAVPTPIWAGRHA